MALGLQDMRPGEICLVARVADNVNDPGLTVVPEVPKKQFRQATILVAHLDSGKLPDPEPDDDRRPKGRSNLAPLPESPMSEIPELDPSTP